MQDTTNAAVETDIRVGSSKTTTSHSDIEALAYQLWKDRGCPDGSPEDDWYKAEEQLSGDTRQTRAKRLGGPGSEAEAVDR